MNKIEEFSDYCKARQVTFEESARLVKRDSGKYTKMVLGLWTMPLVIPGSEDIKDPYFFMRHIDDVMDGDLKVNGDALTYVENIREDILNGSESKKYPIERLAFRSMKILNEKKREGDNPKKDFLDGIDGMIRDHKRGKEKGVLTIDGLRENYVKAFGPHHNISLTAVGSKLRSDNIKTFSYCQGYSYGIRDWSGDWEKGLINIPGEVLNQASLWVNSDIVEVKSSQIIKEWIGDESSKSRIDLNNFFKDISGLEGEKSANLLFNSLGKRVVRILDSTMKTEKTIFVSGSK
jgi:hypothetical protein